MVRVGAIRIASLLVLMAYPALCQHARERTSNGLPDAPRPQHQSALVSLADTFPLLYSRSHSQTFQLRNFNPQWENDAWRYWTDWDTGLQEEREDNNEFRRQLVSLLRHRATYQPSSDSGVMARAASAALGTFFSRDASGQARLKTSYVLGVLTSAVLHTAYRPYWNRPVSAPFSDFGSTVGNDAGMNLLHEFRPSLEELIKGHTPKFISRIEASIGRK
jgi:hypothetical protein